MNGPSPADLHLADLHALARKLEVPDFRLLRRDELVAEIEERGGSAGYADEVGRSRAEPGPAADESGTGARETGEPEATEEVTGVLEVTRQRHGFLRLAGPEPDPDDVYVSASQIRRCELKAGDQVTGPARAPRRGEKHRALIHVDLVNGEEPPDRDRPDATS